MIKPITACRSCGSDRLLTFLDLGEQHLSDFLEYSGKTRHYPIVAALCDDCKLAQLRHTTPQVEMYHDRYGFKSGISDSIKNDLKDNVEHALRYVPAPKTWLDIASNDGTLLSFAPKSTFRMGVDPVSFLCEEAKPHANMIINDYFSADLFIHREIFDIVTSISVFYDMPDPNKFVKDVKSVLAEDGVWIIQQNYLLTTMELGAVDNFCHEHLEYYTLLSLEKLLNRHGLEVNEVYLSTVNGGSIRTVVSHKGSFPVDASVEECRAKERATNLDSIWAYREFASKAQDQVNELRELVEDLHDAGKKIAILAASTRGATIWQAAGLDSKLIDYAIERNPAKVGKYFSAIDVPIISEEEARKRNPDYMLVGPWFFAGEIVERERTYVEGGGSLVVPLPKVKVVNKDSIDEYIGSLATNVQTTS